MSESPSERRRRLINLGELIALAALAVSAVGVWIAWKSSTQDKPTRVVEQRQPIPLTLRGKVEDDGRALLISPVEQGHALESLTLTINGASPVELGGDGTLNARDVEGAFKNKGEGKGPHTVPVRIDARYVEMGKDRHGGGNYVLRYRWEGGGLLGGRSLRLVGLRR
jgi:hypothetical protein